MAPRADSAKRIEGDQVSNTLDDYLVAVGANPLFVIIGIGACAWLNGVFNAALGFGALYTAKGNLEIQLFGFFAPAFAVLGPIAPGHLVPTKLVRVGVCPARRTVAALNIVQAPGNLSGRVGRPVWASAGHFCTR